MVEDLATDCRWLKLDLPVSLAAGAAMANYFEYNLFAGRGVESLANGLFSSLRDHYVDAICRHRLQYSYGVRSRLPKLQVFVLCSGQIDPTDSVLVSFPFAIVV